MKFIMCIMNNECDITIHVLEFQIYICSYLGLQVEKLCVLFPSRQDHNQRMSRPSFQLPVDIKKKKKKNFKHVSKYLSVLT